MDHQLRTLRLYKLLVELRPDWGGFLVFSCGPEAAKSGAAPAASIAGAASLLVAEDGHEVKKAFRRGEIDFVVNSLDEAIRALKNEVRKKKPLSVAVIADVEATLAEMVERGLQPDAFLTRGPVAEGAQALLERGVPHYAVDDEAEAGAGLVLHGERHDEYFVSTATPTELRDADARMLRMLPKDETVRRRWAERAGHYLRGAAGGRWAYLSEGEAGLLESEGLTVRSLAEEISFRSLQESQPTAP